MYELIEIAALAVIAVMGVLAAIIPQKIVKKSIAENPSRLKAVRILGALLAVGCVVVIGMILAGFGA